MYVLWLAGSKVLVSTKQVHNSLREQVVLHVWTQSLTCLRFWGMIQSQR